MSLPMTPFAVTALDEAGERAARRLVLGDRPDEVARFEGAVEFIADFLDVPYDEIRETMQHHVDEVTT